jgi:hypothetical protein
MSHVEIDWMDYANCAVSDTEDTSFVRKPDEVTRKRWQKICLQCEAFELCDEWANQPDEDGFKPAGVFAAGEWRE